eukprot:gene20529-25172_t
MAQLIGWPQERGIVTIWIAHTTFCSAYVAIVVSARLRELDLSIEEAAMDLGARPWKVFILITIPMIAPSLAAGGMMSFALSLDDLVLASFVSGPGSTTLPMEVFSAVRLGVKPEINAVASLILMAVSNFSFALLAMAGHSNWGLAGAIGFENIASGIGGVVVVAYFSALCDLRFTA